VDSGGAVAVPTLEELIQKRCQSHGKGVSAFTRTQAQEYLICLTGWILSNDGKSISQDYVMRNFVTAVALIQKISEVAESEDHHPDVHLTGYRKLSIELTTHFVGGLSENDFILAAKINQLPKALKQSP
jgi:4a-hydroxytetrahydrobiopterin dehydratase